MARLYWLPKHPDFQTAWGACKLQSGDLKNRIDALRALAQYDLEFTQYINIDRQLQKIMNGLNDQVEGYSSLKLALLSSSTVDHVLPLIRTAALRRGLLVDCYVSPFNSVRQEVLDTTSGLHAFNPDVVWFALDYLSFGFDLPLLSSVDECAVAVQSKVDDVVAMWRAVKSQLKSTVVQETVVLPSSSIFGHLEGQISSTPHSLYEKLNQSLRAKMPEEGVLAMDHDALASLIGKMEWMSPLLWHHAKQLVSPACSALYGDHVARVLAAVRGKSYKCLALDLDNTLWGGVIGDDGVEGLELGAGSALGEAFQSFQRYVKRLKERGIILAACSKNDEAVALHAFETHPEMILKKDDFSAFVANWEDKASNLARVAKNLNIGCDAIVFFDDNPIERALVRQFQASIAVHETPEDPALYEQSLSAAGYFEAVVFSSDDAERANQYQANVKRQQAQSRGNDLEGFLQSLKMEMDVRPFDAMGRSRIAQLVNKSNQFNLTTHRYTEVQIEEFEKNVNVLTYQVRLKDSFGDNGMIGVLIAKPSDAPDELAIDTWLMSCRVLGRQVEYALLNVLAAQARVRGFKHLVGEYIPTEKNQLVKEHYRKLGFVPVADIAPSNKNTRWRLSLLEFKDFSTAIQIKAHHHQRET